ncbi:transcription factor [Rhodotorula toruloides]|uniref:Transcription factor n=1 Tax=Rhodotorula toruloides TaxID=5286 RepID=A0A511KLK3_RHOTO|nr:transcription factor [Rhodotorula toruloides]
MQAHLPTHSSAPSIQLDPALAHKVAASAPHLAAGLGAYADQFEALARASGNSSAQSGSASGRDAETSVEAGIPVGSPAPEGSNGQGHAHGGSSAGSGSTGGQFGSIDASGQPRQAASRGGRTKSTGQTGALASPKLAERTTIRKERNRLAAQRSRDRKAAEFERLERLAEDKTQENSILQKELELYKKRVKDLEEIVRALQAGAPVSNIHIVGEPVLPQLPTLDKPLHNQGQTEDIDGDHDLNLG